MIGPFAINTKQHDLIRWVMENLMRHIISSHMLCLYMAWHTILYRVLQWKVHFCDLYRYSLPFPWSWSESCVLAQSSGRKGVEIDFLGKTRPCSQWPDHFCNMDKTCLLKHVYYNRNINFCLSAPAEAPFYWKLL